MIHQNHLIPAQNVVEVLAAICVYGPGFYAAVSRTQDDSFVSRSLYQRCIFLHWKPYHGFNRFDRKVADRLPRSDSEMPFNDLFCISR